MSQATDWEDPSEEADAGTEASPSAPNLDEAYARAIESFEQFCADLSPIEKVSVLQWASALHDPQGSPPIMPQPCPTRITMDVLNANGDVPLLRILFTTPFGITPVHLSIQDAATLAHGIMNEASIAQHLNRIMLAGPDEMEAVVRQQKILEHNATLDNRQVRRHAHDKRPF